MIEDDIRDLFKKMPQILYGYANIDYSRFCKRYKSALVFAVPHGYQASLKTYSESRFEEGIAEAREVVDEVVMKVETLLKENSIDYYVPPTGQENEEELRAPFSFKFVAVNAGLGWIGKNDVVITERYGPRIRLSAILIDHEFDYGRRIIKSRCPENCNRCVEICPHKALKGTEWNMDKLRSEIIDYNLCNKKRSEYIRDHGRKNSCGLCLAVCPIGDVDSIYNNE